MNPHQKQRKLYVAIIGAGPVGLTSAANLALILGPTINIEVYERRIDWNTNNGCYEWISEEKGNRRREQVVTLQDSVVDLLTHEKIHRLFDGERVWRTSRNVAIRDLEDRILAFCQNDVACASSIRFSRLPSIVHDDSGRVDTDKFRRWISSLDVDVLIGADGANSLTRSSFGIHQVTLGETDANLLKRTDFALGIGLTADGVDGGQRQPLNAALTLAQNRYLLNSEQGKRGYLNIRLTPDEYELLRKKNKQGTCGFANPINIYNLYREPEAEGGMPLVDGVEKIEEIISEGLNLFNLSWRHVNSVVGIQISPSYADKFYTVNQDRQRPTHVLLAGDAAMSHHFWPGRGLNTGLKAAMAATKSIIAFVKSNNTECFCRFDLFMTLLRFREMQGRSASMMRKDNSLPHWLDDLENLPANRKPAEGSLTGVVVEETSKNANYYREEFLKNVLAWNVFNEKSGGWPHKKGSVTEEMVRQLLYTNQSRPKALTLRTMVESAVSNNPQRAGWPIHQQRGIGKFSSEVSPEGWYVEGLEDKTNLNGPSLEKVKQSSLELIHAISTWENSETDMIVEKFQLCNIDLDIQTLSGCRYETLIQEGIDVVKKTDFELPTVFVLGDTNAGKSTLIASMRGDSLFPKYDKEIDVHSLVPGPGYAGPAIGKGEESVTYFPVSYPITTPHGSINMCDTAGFFESRGAVYEAVGVGLSQFVLAETKRPSGFLLVCEYSKFQQEVCGHTLKRTLDLLAQIFPASCNDSTTNIVLMISKVPVDYSPRTLLQTLQNRHDNLLSSSSLGNNKRDRGYRKSLEFLLQRSILATFGIDNSIKFLPRGCRAGENQQLSCVKGAAEMRKALGLWEPFSSARFANLSTACGGNARTLLGGILLQYTNEMYAGIIQGNSLVAALEACNAHIEAHLLPELTRHRRVVEMYSQQSHVVKQLLDDGMASAVTRKENIRKYKKSLEDLDRDTEEVIWEKTLNWYRGEKGDDKKEITFEAGDGQIIENVTVEVSSHVEIVKSHVSTDHSSYVGTFLRQKRKEYGNCTVTLTSLYCNLPPVAMARKNIEQMINDLCQEQVQWEKEMREILEPLLIEGTRFITEAKESIKVSESQMSAQQTENEDLRGKLHLTRGRLVVPPNYPNLLSVYNDLCDAEGAVPTTASFPSDVVDMVRSLRSNINKLLESDNTTSLRIQYQQQLMINPSGGDSLTDSTATSDLSFSKEECEQEQKEQDLPHILTTKRRRNTMSRCDGKRFIFDTTY